MLFVLRLTVLVPFLCSDCNVQGKRHICEKLLVCYKYLHFLPCKATHKNMTATTIWKFGFDGQFCDNQNNWTEIQQKCWISQLVCWNTVLIFEANLFTDAKYLIHALFLKIDIIQLNNYHISSHWNISALHYMCRTYHLFEFSVLRFIALTSGLTAPLWVSAHAFFFTEPLLISFQKRKG